MRTLNAEHFNNKKSAELLVLLISLRSPGNMALSMILGNTAQVQCLVHQCYT